MFQDLPTFLWRYFTGHFIDGRQRGNSSWFKRGDFPAHQMTWWVSKARWERAMWRTLPIMFAVGWYLLYRMAPVWHANLMVIVTVAFLPYLFHNLSHHVAKRIPKVHVIHVFETGEVESEDADHFANTTAGIVSEDGELDTLQLPAEMTMPRRRSNR